MRRKTKKVLELKQEIESRKKAAARPKTMEDTVVAYKTVESGLKAKLAAAELTIKKAEDFLSTQIDEALRDEIASKYAQVDKEIKDLDARKVPLAKEIKGLETRISDEQTALTEKKDALKRDLETKGRVEKKTDELEKTTGTFQTEANLKYRYLQLLNAKTEVAEVKGEMDAATLDTKLTAMWQQINTQAQLVADLNDQLRGKRKDKEDVDKSLTEPVRDRNAAIKKFIDVIGKP